jgi:F-type H+-transporting ATPase subunit a
MSEETSPEQKGKKSPASFLAVLACIGLAAMMFFGQRFGISKMAAFAVSAIVSLAAFLASFFSSKGGKGKQPYASGLRLLAIGSAWITVVGLLTLLSDPTAVPEKFTVEISSPRKILFGISFSESILVTWVVMAVLTVAALIIRLFVVPKFKDEPGKIQNLLEAAVEWVNNYCVDKAGHDYGPNLSAYIFSIALLMSGCALVEIVRVRAPTADVLITASYAIVSFCLFNYYSTKHLGFKGRIKAMLQPSPFLLPIKLIVDIFKPVSLACRLFGNMLGGLVVMDLLHAGLGNLAVGLQGIVGLFFNIFHPLLQVFIFVTLTLAFIKEAAE